MTTARNREVTTLADFSDFFAEYQAANQAEAEATDALELDPPEPPPVEKAAPPEPPTPRPGTSKAASSRSSMAQSIESSREMMQVVTALAGLKSELMQAGLLQKPSVKSQFLQVTEFIATRPRQDQGVLPVVAQQLQYQRQLLLTITYEMRQATDVETLLRVTVNELQTLLKANRVLIFQFKGDTQGTVLAEAVEDGWTPTQDETLPALCFGAKQAGDYLQGHTVIEGGNQRKISPYQKQLLEQYQINTSIALPLVMDGKVWGLVVAHHCQKSHQWQESEISLLYYVSTELTVRLQSVESKRQLQQQIEREQLVSKIIGRIRGSLSSDSIFKTTVREIRQFLRADRVGVFQFYPDSGYDDGEFVAEDVQAGFPSAMQTKIHDHCFGSQYADKYKDGRIQAVADIYNTGLKDCHIEVLAQFQIRANLIVPLLKGDELWGLFCIHQCSAPRQWQASEVEFVKQVATQLSVILQQVEQTQELKNIAEREQTLSRLVTKTRQAIDLESIFATTTQEVRKLFNLERVTIYKFRPDFFGDFIAESEADGYPKLVGSGWEDPYLAEYKGGRFRKNEPLVVDDVYTGETIWENGRFNVQKPKVLLTDCHVEALESFGVRACAVVAIFKGNQLWGLLSTFRNTGPRRWEEGEIKLLMQIANQIGIAIQQTEQAEVLRKTAEREQAITRVISKIRQTLDVGDIFATATQEVRKLLNLERVTIYKFRPDFFGDFIAESESGGWPKLVGSGWEDPYISEHKGGRFLKNEPLVVDDVYSGETIWENGKFSLRKPKLPLTDCHVEALESFHVRSCAVVSIFQGNQLWGLLSAFQNTAPRQWEEGEIKLLMQIANQIGIAIQQTEQAETLKKTVEREQAITRVISKIRQTSDVESVFTTATQEIRKLLNLERVTIYKFRPDFFGDFVAESESGGWPKLVGSGWEDSYINEHKGGRFLKNEPLIVDDIYTGETIWENGQLNLQKPKRLLTDCHVEALESYEVKACAVVAIFKGDQLWGLLSAFQNTTPRRWEEGEVRLLMQIAAQLGVATQQAEQAQELRKTVEREQALSRVANKIRQSTDLESVFSVTTQEVRKLMDVERVAVYKFRPDYYGDIISESKVGDYPSLAGAAWEDPYLQEHQGGRFRSGEPLIVDDVYTAGLTDCHLEALEGFGFKSCAVVAIFQGQQLWGLLSAFQHSGPKRWEEGEARFLAQVAAQIGLALQQAEYLEQLKTQAHEGALAIAREKAGKEQIQQHVMQLLTSVRPALMGDLTVRAPITEDEVGTVADAYNNTIQSLRKVVTQVQSAVSQVTNTSRSNETSIAQLSQEAQRQLQQVNEAIDRLQAMTNSTQAVTTSAQQVEAAVQQANQTVKAGDLAMNRTVDGILAIRETVAETSKKIKRLSESSQKVSKVVSLIGNFTTQTQLLALNASIEATRAGEYGRGFSVVADEVRSLSRQSAEATREIEKLVQEIQTEISSVTNAMDQGIQQVVGGTNLVNDTRQQLNAIVAATAQISQLVQGITQAAQVQTQQSKLVTQAMSDVAAIANKTSVDSKQIAASFQELMSTAQQLQTSAAQFKVN